MFHMFHLFVSHLLCSVVCALGGGYSLTETERSYHRRVHSNGTSAVIVIKKYLGDLFRRGIF